LRTRCEWKPLI